MLIGPGYILLEFKILKGYKIEKGLSPSGLSTCNIYCLTVAFALNMALKDKTLTTSLKHRKVVF